MPPIPPPAVEEAARPAPRSEATDETTIEQKKKFAEAIVKGCFQLGAVVYTLVLEDENGVLHRPAVPLSLIDMIHKASCCRSFADISVLEFKQAWEKYADESTDPIIKFHRDKYGPILFDTFTSGYKEVSWATAGLFTEDIICFLKLLVSVEDGMFSRYYIKQCNVLKNIADLLSQICVVPTDDTNKRKEIFCSHLKDKKSQVTIFPILGVDHAVYMTVLPPVPTSSLYTVVFCDGSGSAKYHRTKVDSPNPNIRGHCILQCSYDGVEDIIDGIATFWRSPLIHDNLSRYCAGIWGNFVVREADLLFKGEDPLFPNQKIYMQLQATGNCGLHNLLEAMYFTCAPGSDDIDLLQLRYCMFETALVLLQKCRCGIEASVGGYVFAERCAWHITDAQYKFFDKYPPIDTPCMREIRATHASKAVDDEEFVRELKSRREFSDKMRDLFYDGSYNEAALQEVFGGRLTREKLHCIMQDHAKLKSLYENGGPSLPEDHKPSRSNDFL